MLKVLSENERVCSRTGCNSTNCSRYSKRYGWICHECFKELIELKTKIDIKHFMDYGKVNDKNANVAYIIKEFPLTLIPLD
jgi:hypothetical protein